MRSFDMGRLGGDPWFRIGNLDVTTTVLVAGLGLISMFVSAIETVNGPILNALSLEPSAVFRGQIWRVVTWPIPNDPNLWNFLLIAVFVMLGSQLEQVMGRRLYSVYLGALVLIPALAALLFYAFTNRAGWAEGLRLVELGVLCGFALRMPNVRFFGVIPAWILAAVIVVINLLQLASFRGGYEAFMLVIVVAVALIGLKSLGFADEADWLPSVPLPAAALGASGYSNTPKQGRTLRKRKKRRRKSHLESVPPTSAPRRGEMTKADRDEMDAILDQVSEEGLDSLNPFQQRLRGND